MYRQFNIQQFYVLPTVYLCVYLCVLYASESKQRLFPYEALTDWFYNRDSVTARYGLNCYFCFGMVLCFQFVHGSGG